VSHFIEINIHNFLQEWERSGRNEYAIMQREWETQVILKVHFRLFITVIICVPVSHTNQLKTFVIYASILLLTTINVEIILKRLIIYKIIIICDVVILVFCISGFYNLHSFHKILSTEWYINIQLSMFYCDFFFKLPNILNIKNHRNSYLLLHLFNFLIILLSLFFILKKSCTCHTHHNYLENLAHVILTVII